MGNIWTSWTTWTDDTDCRVQHTDTNKFTDDYVYEGAEPDAEEDAIIRVFWRQQRTKETPVQRRERIHAAMDRVRNFYPTPSTLSKCIYGQVAVDKARGDARVHVE